MIDIYETTMTMTERMWHNPSWWEEISLCGNWIYVITRDRDGDLNTIYRYPNATTPKEG